MLSVSKSSVQIRAGVRCRVHVDPFDGREVVEVLPWRGHGRASRQDPPDGGRPPRADLFSSHNSDEGWAAVRWASDASYCQVSIPSGETTAGGGKRGRISKFTPASRNRMQQFCSSISRRSIATGSWASVTLTYHLRQVTPVEAKVHLKSFAAAMRRQWGPLGTIWKLEAQERGAPHFHLLVQLKQVVGVDAFAAWATEAWHAIAEPESPLHLRWHRGELGNGNKHCVHAVVDFEEFLYASKYASKPQGEVPGWDWPGRY